MADSKPLSPAADDLWTGCALSATDREKGGAVSTPFGHGLWPTRYVDRLMSAAREQPDVETTEVDLVAGKLLAQLQRRLEPTPVRVGSEVGVDGLD